MIRPPPRSPLFPSTPLSRSIRARPAKAAEPTSATARADRAKIESVQRTIRRVRGNGVEGDQPSCENNQNSFQDRKSTRLNSSHSQISYAVFCLKKKKTTPTA